MPAHYPVSVISAVNDYTILRDNLLASPCFKPSRSIQYIFQEHYSSASLAYSDAMTLARHDLLMFVHQDVYLPGNWLDHLFLILDYLDVVDPDWGILGCYGRRSDRVHGLGRVHTTGCGWHGIPLSFPVVVDTLDEIVLIFRKSSGLRFDPALPHFHLYGTDLCLSARSLGRQAWVIPLPCIHNTDELIELPQEFYSCYDYIKFKWRQYLPIHTPCSRISFFNEDIMFRKLRSWYRFMRGKSLVAQPRLNQPAELFFNLFAEYLMLK